MTKTTNHTTVDDLNRASVGKLPEHLGVKIIEVTDRTVAGRFGVRPDLVSHTSQCFARLDGVEPVATDRSRMCDST
jgi:1,4-dihydroxy-2-naphthoyl-CoA hydrolase